MRDLDSKITCILIIIIGLAFLFLAPGCAGNKQFTYNLDKVYEPLPGETAYDPAPWPY